MQIFWTSEALDDLAEIVAHYHAQGSPRAAKLVESRIITQVEALPSFPERIRQSERIPGVRELVVSKLPYIIFLKVQTDAIVVLNVVHTARRFPA